LFLILIMFAAPPAQRSLSPLLLYETGRHASVTPSLIRPVFRRPLEDIFMLEKKR
jgi:hypothetical protein